MQRKNIALIVAFALLAGLVWFVLATRGRAIDTASIEAWAMHQGLAPGRTDTLALPPNLATFARDHVVTVAHQANGRYCFLVKTSVGWKDNFDGLLWCTAPLTKSEIVTPDDNRHQYVSIPGYGVFEELYVSRFRSDRIVDVYFDLN